ncbi:MAG: sulfatase-like hydrolase/transferase [Planctomycetota bacterium]|nr:sulfatase-like hydrolase/transferase [Planctomycetota bacterium]
MQSRPNILWISIEDINPRLGCYGDPVARTPNIDKLAAGGCIYPNAFSTAGVCAPSRSAIITGMYQTSIGTHHMRTTHQNRDTPEMPTPYSAVIPHYVKTFTEYLRAGGYYCTNNSKTDYQFTPPITAWDELSDEAHWRNRPENAPFFSVFNPTMTHESGMWGDDDLPEARKLEPKTNPDDVVMPPYLPDTPKARAALARHYDTLEKADEFVGRVLGELEEDGLADNTIVFLWSDHGAGLPRGKRWPYDAGIRIPLIVRWPGTIERGTQTDQLVSLVDLGQTVLSLSGINPPAHMQGQPFLGERTLERDYIFAARDRHDESYDMVRAARDKRFKYIRNFRPDLPYLLWIPYRNRHPIMQEMWRLHAEGKLEGPQTLLMQNTRPIEELYDTETDPWEINNLSGNPEYAETLIRMRKALDDWRDEVGDLGDMPEYQMVASWYPNGEQPKTAAPVFVPISATSPGRAPLPQGGSVEGPALLQIHCATQGASVAWTTEQGEDVHWNLYSGPIPLDSGQTTIRSRAIRIGFKESEEREASFEVT